MDGQNTGRSSARARSRRIKLLSPLGKGGFGAVYLADVTSPDGLVQRLAIKLLHESWAKDASITARARDEARLMSQLNHDNILKIYGLTRLNDRDAVLMEYVEGIDCRSLAIAAARSAGGACGLPPRVACAIIERAAGGLAAAWSNRSPQTGQALRVVHRDIKPGNLLLSVNGAVKVMDFGVARAEFEREAMTGSVQFGTHRYMAPERWLKGEADHASDIYSLGITLWELLTGLRFERLPLDPVLYEEKREEQLRYLSRGGLEGEALRALTELLRSMLRYEEGERLEAVAVEDGLGALEGRLPGDGLRRYARRVVPALVAAQLDRLREDPELLDLTGTLMVEDYSQGAAPARAAPAETGPLDPPALTVERALGAAPSASAPTSAPTRPVSVGAAPAVAELQPISVGAGPRTAGAELPQKLSVSVSVPVHRHAHRNRELLWQLRAGRAGAGTDRDRLQLRDGRGGADRDRSGGRRGGRAGRRRGAEGSLDGQRRGVERPGLGRRGPGRRGPLAVVLDHQRARQIQQLRILAQPIELGGDQGRYDPPGVAAQPVPRQPTLEGAQPILHRDGLEALPLLVAQHGPQQLGERPQRLALQATPREVAELLLALLLVEHRIQRQALKAQAGQQLPEGDAQGVDVRGVVGLALEPALGGHVAVGPELHAAGHRLALKLGPGHPEVHDLDRAVHRQQQVAGLDVPVHHPQGLAGLRRAIRPGRGQPPGGPLDDGAGHPRRQPAGAAGAPGGGDRQAAAVDALDVLHQHRVAIVQAGQPVDLQDVVVVELRHQARLVPRTGGDRRVLGPALVQQLDREALNQPVGTRHVGEVDRTKAALAQRAQQLDPATARAGAGAPGVLTIHGADILRGVFAGLRCK